MNEDLISRSEFLNVLQREATDSMDMVDVICILQDVPPAPLPVVHGSWMQGDLYDYGDVCSVCDYDSSMEPCKMKYCPNCGAKMDGGRTDD